jgi:hypothetical protein
MTDNRNLGYKEVIDTLTGIDAQITEQKFYSINIPDYVDIDEGKEPFRESIYRRNIFDVASDGYDGFMDSGSNDIKTARVGVEMEGETDYRHLWAKSIQWNFLDLEKLKRTGDFDLPTSLLSARKKNFDLLVQNIAFNGNVVDSKIHGLLDVDGITVNTTLLTKQIADMTSDELNVFAGKLLDLFYQNTNSTQMPNRFVIPSSDYNRLGNFSSAEYASKSKITFLIETFNTILSGYGVNDFKILPLSYANKEIIGTEQDTYTLYNKNSDSLTYDIPIGYTVNNTHSYDYMNFKSEAYGQIGGLRVKRKQEIMKFVIL